MATVHHPKTTFFLSVSLILALFVGADVPAAPQPLANSTCDATLHPELCASTLAKIGWPKLPDPPVHVPVRVMNKLFMHTEKVNRVGKADVQKLKSLFIKAAGKKVLKKVGGEIIEDCAQMLFNTIIETNEIIGLLQKYSQTKAIIVPDYLTKLSAIETNEDTCIGGFAGNPVDKKIREVFLKNYYEAYTSEVTEGLEAIGKYLGTGAAKISPAPAEDWPGWVSKEDRELRLKPSAATVKADVTVAKDGSGNYPTVSDAVKAAPEGREERYVIRIKAGTYRENVVIPLEKTNLMFVGDGREKTIITGSGSFNDGKGNTVFSSATVAVVGRGFLARDITIKNDAGPENQAVALRVNADHCAFYQCSILGFWNTLYVHSYRQFYKRCLVMGTHDFIFGNAAAVFQECDIQALPPIRDVRPPNRYFSNTVTFQGRDNDYQNTGIVIKGCHISAAPDQSGWKGTTYLGRPWKRHSRTVVMQSIISDVIHPAGWQDRGVDLPLDNVFYAEYGNIGYGSLTGGRVKSKGVKVLTSALEAQPFTTQNFIG